MTVVSANKKHRGEVMSIESNGKGVEAACPGANVGFTIRGTYIPFYKWRREGHSHLFGLDHESAPKLV